MSIGGTLTPTIPITSKNAKVLLGKVSQHGIGQLESNDYN